MASIMKLLERIADALEASNQVQQEGMQQAIEENRKALAALNESTTIHRHTLEAYEQHNQWHGLKHREERGLS